MRLIDRPDAVQYSPDRLTKLGQQAAAPNSPFTLSDRIGIVCDSLALARAGYSTVSSALELISVLHSEKECKHPHLQHFSHLTNQFC